MEETRNTAAIVINRQPYREYDSLVTVYSPKFGKVNLIARGTRRSGSKLAGHIEPLTIADMMIVRGRGFDYIGSAVTRDAFIGIRKDLNKIFFAGRALKDFNKLVREDEADERLFLLLRAWLEVIDSFSNPQETAGLSKEDGELLWSFFILKLLSEIGYKPEVRRCIVCGREIVPGGNRFNLLSGGLVCSQCYEKERESLKGNTPSHYLTVSDNCVKLVRFIIDNKFAQVAKMKITRKIVSELSLLVKDLLVYRK